KKKKKKDKEKEKKKEKEQVKLQNQKDKLSKKLEKIEAKLHCMGENERNHQHQYQQLNCQRELRRKDGQISCMCGAPLIHTTPIAAYYSGARVNCDICGLYCPSNGDIYHCPAEKTKDHPEGYDLCFKCVRFQMRSFQDQHQQHLRPHHQRPLCPMQLQPQPPCHQQKQQLAMQQQKTTEEKDQTKEQPKPTANNKDSALPKGESPVNSPSPIDQLEGFQYATEARKIMNMGFSDVEKIKCLLISKKGDTNQVISHLLSRQF
ncbi:hypothetical protein RFI_05324, partial [Reticulomyxa filosa]